MKSLSLLTWIVLYPFKERKMSLGLGSSLTACNIHFQSYENEGLLPSENLEHNLISPLKYHNLQWCKIHSGSRCSSVCTCSSFYMEKVPDKMCAVQFNQLSLGNIYAAPKELLFFRFKSLILFHFAFQNSQTKGISLQINTPPNFQYFMFRIWEGENLSET